MMARLLSEDFSCVQPGVTAQNAKSRCQAGASRQAPNRNPFKASSDLFPMEDAAQESLKKPCVKRNTFLGLASGNILRLVATRIGRIDTEDHALVACIKKRKCQISRSEMAPRGVNGRNSIGSRIGVSNRVSNLNAARSCC